MSNKQDRPSVADTLAEALAVLKPGRLGAATTALKSQMESLLGKATDHPAPNIRASVKDALGKLPSLDLSSFAPSALAPSKFGSAGVRSRDGAAPSSDDATDGAGTFTWHTITTEAGARRFKLYVPHDGDSQPRPLVVMLHGCTQSPDDFAAGTRMNAVADHYGALVAYPEQTAQHNSSKCWNWFKPEDQMRDRGEPALVAAMVRQIMREHAIDAKRVFVAGLSAGGAAAAVLAQTYPDLFAGACVHSGLACGAARDLSGALAAMRSGAPGVAAASSVPTIVFHGADDRTVNPANGRHVTANASAGLGAPTIVHGRSSGDVPFTRSLFRDAAGRVVVEHWLIEGRAGHAWSGGSQRGSYTFPAGPDASAEAMRFFMAL